ncbi:MAG: 3-dehydroquinate synthase [Gemmatimonadota bacterium]|jgi:3-dehydroquinate synthase|nr:3-dehydroquinate synthase [Gemmatimonadota bacterium]MDQ8146661.1 3-dehydroquinate synthase [Gemmatimonadota bacterium]MDQ8148853.1 3-dehydroquinate synthase [Gemmatimonadota bacterium]MDQ8156067.1 3-dehydroquinate synthase [Gemmatimonadota bacterium]MDQ8176015.1 3-dehydroquinate synthase [Gemmatimonadota bacterium]
MPTARTLHGARLEVAPGLGAALGARLATGWPRHRVAVVIDTTVDTLHGAALRAALPSDVTWCPIPPGETTKTRATWAAVTDTLHAAGLGRDTVIVAVGGGVTTDLTGFVAATFARGVPTVLVPTTLLAMVDAAIGGKTGVDTPFGKNLVGALHHPDLVLIDPRWLDTLPRAERRHGAAEALKHGIVADAAHVDWLTATLPGAIDATPIPPAIADALLSRSVEIKAEIVEADPEDRGRRRVLNFGHTIGHALERLSDYTIPHGAAVAIGMVAEARLGERLGVTHGGVADRITAACDALALPTQRPSTISADAIVAATRADKKASGGQVAYALPETLGTMAGATSGFVIPVPDADVLHALTEM